MKLRIKFSKLGAVKFIGHLDIMRYFQKAIRRAEIDIAYSTGFSAHQIMSFASPLGVGLESTGEYFDIEVNSMISCEDIRSRLNQTMVEGIEVLAVRQLSEESGNAMASIQAAAYQIKAKENTNTWIKLFKEFINQPTIMALKKTKKSEKTINIKEFIYHVAVEEDSITLLVNSSSSGNINPGFIMQVFCKEYEEMADFRYQITRLELYGNRSDGDSQELIPLLQL